MGVMCPLQRGLVSDRPGGTDDLCPFSLSLWQKRFAHLLFLRRTHRSLAVKKASRFDQAISQVKPVERLLHELAFSSGEEISPLP
jgi:hypothetical protein